MQQKTERFELRLDPAQLERVDEWRRRQEDFPTRAEAIRTLVEDGLNRKSQPQVSDGEKLLLIMLGELIEGLKLKTDLDPQFIADVIHGGHYWALDWKYSGIFHGHSDKREIVSEVVRFLDMWSFLESSVDRLTTEEKERVVTSTKPWSVSYPGFDGNHESDHMSIAGFLIEKMGRFGRLKDRGYLNSHMPVLERHRRMLHVFEPIRNNQMGDALNADQIIQIVNARSPTRHN